MENKLWNSWRIPPSRRQWLYSLALLAYCLLPNTVWAAPAGPGWCKNNTFLNPQFALSFGTFTSEGGGRIVIDTNGQRSSPDGAGVILLGGTPQVAVFSITGCANDAYSIITPPDSSLVFGTNTMTLTTFTTDPVGAGILDINGQDTLKIGATLNVNFPQAGGSYSGTYTVEIVVQ